MVTIQFDETYVDAGFDIILSTDTVVFTADSTIFHVPETSLEPLKKKNIPFHRITNWQEKKKELDAKYEAISALNRNITKRLSSSPIIQSKSLVN